MEETTVFSVQEAYNLGYEDGFKTASTHTTQTRFVKERTCRYKHIEGTWYMSECGKRYDYIVPPNYCPNCGAKVVE